MLNRWLSPLLDADGDIGAASGDQSGVEEASVAGEQAAEQEHGGEQQHEIRDEKDFASAFRQREEKLQSKYEQEYAPYKQHSSKLDTLAKQLGFSSADEYLQAAEEQARERQAAEEAQRLGMDMSAYNEHLAPLKDRLSKYEQELQQLRQSDIERQVRADYDRLRATHPDFEAVAPDVFKLASERGYSLDDAYKLVTYDSRLAATKQETEQEVLARVTGRDAKQVLPGSDKGAGVKFDPAQMSLKDIEALSARVQAGERIEL